MALPQFVAELAILVAVYGASRRLGFAVLSSTAGALLLATFSLLALEASTAQNDLVAASFPVVAACLLLGAGRSSRRSAGAAVGVRARREALDRARPADPRLARARARPAHARGGVAGGLAGSRRDRHVGLRAQRRPLRGVLGAGHAPSRTALARVPAQRRERLLPPLRADGRVGPLEPADPRARARRRRARGRRRGLGLRRAARRAGAADGIGVAMPFLAPLLVIGGAGARRLHRRRLGLPDPRRRRAPRAGRGEPEPGVRPDRERGLLGVRAGRDRGAAAGVGAHGLGVRAPPRRHAARRARLRAARSSSC